MKHPIRIIGITGGIGSGKSTFASEFQRFGCRVIEADAIAHELIDSDATLRKALFEAFGPRFFDQKGCLKRRALGKRVFGDPEALALLNQIVWPPLLHKIQDLITRSMDEDESRPIVVDIAILFEANIAAWFDLIIVVFAPLEKRIRWLATSRGWNEKEIMARIASQWPDEKKKTHADVIIENDGDLEALRQKAQWCYRNYIRST